MSAEYITNNDEVFRQLEIYPWSTDKEFQSGLAAILGPKSYSDPSQIYDLTLRAQCFYYSRKKSIPIDFSAYKAYLSAHISPPNSNTSSTLTPTTLTTLPSSTKMAVQLPHSDTSSPSTASASTPQPQIKAAVAPPPPHPAAFQEIIALIRSGLPIPGIMDIPDTVLTGQSSVPILPKRKKPWEKDLPSTTEGTFGDQRDIYIAQELPEELPPMSAEEAWEKVANEMA